MRRSEILDKIRKSIPYKDIKEDEDFISITLDRYRRHDHGGGEDGDDCLEDYKIDQDFETGQKTYKFELDKVNQILKESGLESNAKFELSEKGYFRIVINLKLK
jgi:hypothetical protein